MKEKLKLYLKTMIKNEGSDLHIKAGSQVRVRIHGALKILGEELFTAEMAEELTQEITTQEQYQRLKKDKSIDFSYALGDENRFRVNIFYQMDGLSAAFRVIPTNIMSFAELGLPKEIETFSKLQRGLVLVTGVTGSGKSTTLAAILNKINQEQKKHIIVLEDPIEFIHKDKGCLVNQREIGQDVNSFSDALRSALREDPDIILVGEMRDLETIDIVLHAANTGHLVFSTLHTPDAKETISRIVDMFGSEEQNRIRVSLASVLEGVISQRLIPSIGGGRTVSVEILKKTARIEQLIIEKRDSEILDAISEGRKIYGTQTFDQSLIGLLAEGKINTETALEYATSPSDMKLKIQGIGEGSILHQDAMCNDEDNDLITFKEKD